MHLGHTYGTAGYGTRSHRFLFFFFFFFFFLSRPARPLGVFDLLSFFDALRRFSLFFFFFFFFFLSRESHAMGTE